MFEKPLSRTTAASLIAALAIPSIGFALREREMQQMEKSLSMDPSPISLVVKQEEASSPTARPKIQRVEISFSPDSSEQMSPIPVKRGEDIYNNMGCAVCHSTDGSDGIGPTWKGIWERQGKLVDGSSYTVDADYIKESITEPALKVKDGYSPIMPSYKEAVSDRDIAELISFMKSL